MKRLLSFLIVCLLLLGSIQSLASEAENTNSDKFINNLSILNSVGISIALSSEAQTVTREKLAEYALFLTQIKEEKVPSSKYIDIPAKHYAADLVYTVDKYGLMSGYHDNTFRINEIATPYQFGRVLLYMLDYSILAANFQWTESDYNKWLMKTSLLKGVSGAQLNEGIVAQMLVNMLTEPVVTIDSFSKDGSFEYTSDSGKIYLTEKCSIVKSKGRLEAVGKTSLIGSGATKQGKLIINKMVYLYDKEDMTDYLGYNVEFYATDDNHKDEQNILYITVKEPADEIKIDSNDIVGFENYKLKYYENDSLKTKAINKNKALIILNGYRAMDVNEKIFCPLSGSVRLVDYNGDNEIDTVFIKSKIYYKLSQVVTETYTFTDKDTGGSFQSDEDSFEYYIGKEKNDIEAIKRNSVVAVAPNSFSYKQSGGYNVPGVGTGKPKIRMEQIENSVSGKVNGISSDAISIYSEEDEKTIDYELSEWYVTMIETGIYKKPGLDSTATVYLENNKIVYIESNSVFVGENRKYTYGYLVKISAGENSMEALQFKIFTEFGTMEIYEATDNFKLNGIKTSNAKITQDDKLFQNGVLQRQLVSFEADENNKLTALFTAVDHANPKITTGDTQVDNPDYSSTYAGYDLDCFSLDFANTSAVYRHGIKHLYSVNDKLTKVFVIPLDSEEDKHFMIRNQSYLIDSSSYNLKLYDIQKNFVVSACVVFVKAGNGSVEIPLELYGGNVSSIVTKKTNAIDEEGSVRPLVYVMQNQYPYKAGVQNGAIKAVFAADDELVSYNGSRYSGGIYTDVPYKDLKPGDIIMYKTNDFGEMNTFRVLMRYQDLYDENGKFICREINTTEPTSSMYITCAKVTDIFDDYTFTFNVDPSESISGLRYGQNGIKAANMAVSIYDTSKKTNMVTSATLKDLRIGDTIVTRSESGICLEVFIFRK